ncbi:MAG: FHA domain-containing protein [Clostridia bacterium]
MQSTQRCPNGHYYDDTLYSCCPYCKGEEKTCAQTMPFRDGPEVMASANSAIDKTIRVIVKETGIDPVTGWLVCVDGSDKGCDYRLHGGNNFIGRSPEMDICIKGDESISAMNHASVSYDFRHKNYYIAMGTGKEIVYVNDEPLSGTRTLIRFDKIEIGGTTLLFVPLCGEDFSWQ